jgi:hypothetical protein
MRTASSAKPPRMSAAQRDGEIPSRVASHLGAVTVGHSGTAAFRNGHYANGCIYLSVHIPTGDFSYAATCFSG